MVCKHRRACWPKSGDRLNPNSVFIVIFGIAGGCIRYLYDIASKWKEEIRDNDDFRGEIMDNKKIKHTI